MPESRSERSSDAKGDFAPGLTCAEIAPILGITRSRVWQIEQRAIRKLREGLLEDPYVREWIQEHGLKV